MRDYAETVEKARYCASEGGDCYGCPSDGYEPCSISGVLYEAADAIEELLAAVRSVVHCKDRKFWTKQKLSAQGRCALHAMYPTGGYYCGSGRKDDTE